MKNSLKNSLSCSSEEIYTPIKISCKNFAYILLLMKKCTKYFGKEFSRALIDRKVDNNDGFISLE